MTESPSATAGDLARNLGVGGALFLIALWLFLKYRPWEQRNGTQRNGQGSQQSNQNQHVVQRIDALALKLVTVEAKVDIMWNFQLRRSISEGLAAGTLTRESPLRANVQVLDRHGEVIDGIKHWYEKEAKEMTDLELFIELERRFSVELHHLCETENMLDGACLAATLFILRPNSPMFAQYEKSSWHEVT